MQSRSVAFSCESVMNIAGGPSDLICSAHELMALRVGECMMPGEYEAVLQFAQRAQVTVLEARHCSVAGALTLTWELFLSLPPHGCADVQWALANIIAKVTTTIVEHSRCAATSAGPVADRRPVEHALATICAHFSDASLTLDDIATAVSLSRFHLCRIVRNSTQYGTRTHIRGVRAIRTAHLLSTTLLSIKEIASCTGHSGSAALDHEFRRWFRMTPREFRRYVASDFRPRQQSSEDDSAFRLYPHNSLTG
jgi:AraC-like DNA-binding protein